MKFVKQHQLRLVAILSALLVLSNGNLCAQELDGEYISKWENGRLISMRKVDSKSTKHTNENRQAPAIVIPGGKAILPLKAPRQLPVAPLKDAGLDSLAATSMKSQAREFSFSDSKSTGSNFAANASDSMPAVVIVDAEELLGDSSLSISRRNDNAALAFSMCDVEGRIESEREGKGCATSSGVPWGRSREEYVCDGGDSRFAVKVRNDWSVTGLELEDTVAHFDTLDGRVQVVASNKSCVYAPRFAAVRQVRSLQINEHHDIATGSHGYQGANDYVRDMNANAVKQPVATVRAVGTKMGVSIQQHDRGILIDDVDIPTESRNQLLPYEDLRIVEVGRFDQKDTPILIAGTAAARAWSNVEMPQVTIENGGAFVRTGVTSGEEAFVYEMPKGKPRLRLVKLASVCAANPGDTVRFTIRYDNVGTQPIGNVTVLDMLTTRLQFVEGTDHCTDDSVFTTAEEGGALKMRWEIAEPLEAGDGGVIHFDCIVR